MIITRARRCFLITLNALEALPHQCPVLKAADNSLRPTLQRAAAFESSEDDTVSSPYLIGGKFEGVALGGGAGGRDIALSPVPEDLEGLRESSEDIALATPEDHHATAEASDQVTESLDHVTEAPVTKTPDHVSNLLKSARKALSSENEPRKGTHLLYVL